jgi:hypothetical protein
MTQSVAMPEGANVTLTAKPGKETELVEWQAATATKSNR